MNLWILTLWTVKIAVLLNHIGRIWICLSVFLVILFVFLEALYWDKFSNIDCGELSLVEIIRLGKWESF